MSGAAPGFWQIVSIIISLGALIFAAATFVRAGRWRNTDEGKDLLGRVDAVEERMTKVEVKVDGLATKADIAALQSEVRGLEKSIERTTEGVLRIEQFMMERSK